MPPSQSKASVQAVVESCARPDCRGVADRTVSRETSLDVIRICGCRKLLGMTAETIGRCPLELAGRMAGSTVQLRVSAGESETGKLIVVEMCALPAIDTMATFAREWQTRCTVVDRCCLLVFGEMA